MHAKTLSGTVRPDRIGRSTIDAADRMQALPAPPSGLSQRAQEAWQRLGTLALDAGTLTRFDTELLALAARTAASCEELESQLAADGMLVDSKGTIKAHPACAALDRNRALMLRLLDALGLSPLGRDQIPTKPVAATRNRFAEYFEKD